MNKTKIWGLIMGLGAVCIGGTILMGRQSPFQLNAPVQDNKPKPPPPVPIIISVPISGPSGPLAGGSVLTDFNSIDLKSPKELVPVFFPFPASSRVPGGKGPSGEAAPGAGASDDGVIQAQKEMQAAWQEYGKCLANAILTALKDPQEIQHSPGYTGLGAGFDRHAKVSGGPDPDPCKGAREAYERALAAYNEALAKVRI